MFASGSSEVTDRVKRLRLLRRWDQATLAKKAGISNGTLSLIERGQVAPTDAQIDGIAAALGYSSEFLTAELKLSATTLPWLRAYADASKREVDARTAAATTAAEYIRHLRLRTLPDMILPFDGTADDDEEIEEIASEVRCLAQIEPDTVVKNTIRAAERLGCVVLPLESELGRHLGMSVRADGIPIMCIARGVDGDRQRWTTAHEIGHLTLHGHTGPPRDAKDATIMEKQAHAFAAAFLGPGDALVETLHETGGKVTLTTLQQIKSRWGISIKALVGRFTMLGVIDRDHARSLYKQISARRWTKNEPVYVPPEAAQWLERSLMRTAQTDDLPSACRTLAASIGGDSTDLFRLADWTHGQDAEVISLADRQKRR